MRLPLPDSEGGLDLGRGGRVSEPLGRWQRCSTWQQPSSVKRSPESDSTH